MNKRKNWLVLLSVFFASLIASSAVCATKDEIESLRGLKGIYVLVEDLPDDIKEKGLLTAQQIRTDVELKLRLAGIKVVSKEEIYGIPGRPYLYVNINTITTGTGLVIYSVGINLSQEVILKRNPKVDVIAETWSKAGIGTTGQANYSGMRNSLKDVIDDFINDYLSVNPTKGK